MAQLHDPKTGTIIDLRPSHSVGRAAGCGLVLNEAWISGNHARFDWTGRGWELRDLGSRNGTYVDGRKLPPGEIAPLTDGSRVAFGRKTDEWTVQRTAEAGAGAQRLRDGLSIWAQADMLSLPDDNNPLCTIFRDQSGAWVIDQDGEQRPAEAAELIQVEGEDWELLLPEAYVGTIDTSLPPLALSDVSLLFEVTGDEQQVNVTGMLGDQRFDLGGRAHLYLLLTLARQRLADAERPSAARGWLYTDEIAPRLGLETRSLNVAVHRIRRQFANLPLDGGANIVERRPLSRQIRIHDVRCSIQIH
jgi:hypothetical protein